MENHQMNNSKSIQLNTTLVLLLPSSFFQLVDHLSTVIISHVIFECVMKNYHLRKCSIRDILMVTK